MKEKESVAFSFDRLFLYNTITTYELEMIENV